MHSNVIEINYDTVLDILLSAEDRLICQTQNMIYREHWVFCTKQNKKFGMEIPPPKTEVIVFQGQSLKWIQSKRN